MANPPREERHSQANWPNHRTRVPDRPSRQAAPHPHPRGRCPRTPGVYRIGPRGVSLAAKADRAASTACGTARRHTPLWRRPPLRLPSGRAVSCGRQPNIPRKRPADNPFLSPQTATTDFLTEATAQKKIRSNQHPPLTNLIAGKWEPRNTLKTRKIPRLLRKPQFIRKVMLGFSKNPSKFSVFRVFRGPHL
jgi:hypothetical protein